MSDEKQMIEELAEEILQEYTPCYSEVDKEVLVDMIYDAGFRKQTEWISVDERLPEEPMPCLVYTDNGDIFDSLYNEGFSTKFVTHWMRRPEPPQTKGDAE